MNSDQEKVDLRFFKAIRILNEMADEATEIKVRGYQLFARFLKKVTSTMMILTREGWTPAVEKTYSILLQMQDDLRNAPYPNKEIGDALKFFSHISRVMKEWHDAGIGPLSDEDLSGRINN